MSPRRASFDQEEAQQVPLSTTRRPSRCLFRRRGSPAGASFDQEEAHSFGQEEAQQGMEQCHTER